MVKPTLTMYDRRKLVDTDRIEARRRVLAMAMAGNDIPDAEALEAKILAQIVAERELPALPVAPVTVAMLGKLRSKPTPPPPVPGLLPTETQPVRRRKLLLPKDS